MAKRLYRSVSDRRLAGVCGGIAEYLNIDSLVVRLIFVGLLVFGIAPIILIYLILWVGVPDNPAEIKTT